MRLPNNVRTRFPASYWALGLTALLAACGRGGNDIAPMASAMGQQSNALSGPSADYPVVVGDPYTVDGTLYTPLDTMNYDEVGYAVTDSADAIGVSVAHRTLPMPSYVEITALDSGRTILARVERRGPMTSGGVVALSQAAQNQLEVANNAPIRIRRVNAAEVDREKLRTGAVAPQRMDTPKSLLAVLKRKLPADGSVSLAAVNPATVGNKPVQAVNELAPALNRVAAVQTVQTIPTAVAQIEPMPAAPNTASTSSFEQAFSAVRKTVTAYPLAPIVAAPSTPATMPRRVTATAPTRDKPQTQAAAPANKPAQASNVGQATDAGNFVVQAAAFSNQASAERAANSIDGFVQKSGKFYRVRTGPFVNRGQAEAALAKIRAAGYNDARVFTAG